MKKINVRLLQVWKNYWCANYFSSICYCVKCYIIIIIVIFKIKNGLLTCFLLFFGCHRPGSFSCNSNNNNVSHKCEHCIFSLCWSRCLVEIVSVTCRYRACYMTNSVEFFRSFGTRLNYLIIEQKIVPSIKIFLC